MRKRLFFVLSAFLIIGLTFGLSYMHKASAYVPRVNALISVNNTGNGQGGNGDSSYSSTNNYGSISADGRFVAFVSLASNLVSNDTNGVADVFVRDLAAGTTTRVDVSSSGVQANATANGITSGQQTVALSRTGKYVVFTTSATNLIDGQTTPAGQIYRHDMQTGNTILVSQYSGTPGNNWSMKAYGVSSDGRFVLFDSAAHNLGVTLPSTNDDFLYRADLQNGTFQVLNVPYNSPTTRASTESAAMSCDGSMVVDGELTDPLTANDTNSYNDVYLMDFRNGLTVTDLSSAADRATFTPTISCNGDYIGFLSGSHVYASALISPADTHTHAFVYDRVNSTYTVADAYSSGTVGDQSTVNHTAVDDKGNMVFASSATNFGYGSVGLQLWLHNTQANTVELLSISSGATAGDNQSLYPSISADGKLVSYGSFATNLIASDTNAKGDIFTSQTGL